MKKYTDATKAKVVGAIQAGEKVTAVAKQFKVSIGTIRNWSKANTPIATAKKTMQSRELIDKREFDALYAENTKLKAKIYDLTQANI